MDPYNPNDFPALGAGPAAAKPPKQTLTATAPVSEQSKFTVWHALWATDTTGTFKYEQDGRIFHKAQGSAEFSGMEYLAHIERNFGKEGRMTHLKNEEYDGIIDMYFQHALRRISPEDAPQLYSRWGYLMTHRREQTTPSLHAILARLDGALETYDHNQNIAVAQLLIQTAWVNIHLARRRENHAMRDTYKTRALTQLKKAEGIASEYYLVHRTLGYLYKNLFDDRVAEADAYKKAVKFAPEDKKAGISLEAKRASQRHDDPKPSTRKAHRHAGVYRGVGK